MRHDSDDIKELPATKLIQQLVCYKDFNSTWYAVNQRLGRLLARLEGNHPSEVVDKAEAKKQPDGFVNEFDVELNSTAYVQNSILETITRLEELI